MLKPLGLSVGMNSALLYFDSLTLEIVDSLTPEIVDSLTLWFRFVSESF